VEVVWAEGGKPKAGKNDDYVDGTKKQALK